MILTQRIGKLNFCDYNLSERNFSRVPSSSEGSALSLISEQFRQRLKLVESSSGSIVCMRLLEESRFALRSRATYLVDDAENPIFRSSTSRQWSRSWIVVFHRRNIYRPRLESSLAARQPYPTSSIFRLKRTRLEAAHRILPELVPALFSSDRTN